MASCVATMALAGARPRLPPPSAARGGSSFASTCRGIRGRIARASHHRPHHPSGAAEVNEGVLERLKGAIAALAIIAQVSVSLPANAVLYSPDTKVPRTGELALRRAIPANPNNMKAIQESLEDISYLLRIPQRKPYDTMEGDVKKAMKINSLLAVFLRLSNKYLI